MRVSEKLPLFITQNVDALSIRILDAAELGFSDEEKKMAKERIIEMHGNIFTTRCTICNATKISYDSSLCRAFSDHSRYTDGNGEFKYDPSVRIEDLPRCGGEEWNGSNRYGRCGGLLRPDVVWFGEVPFGMGEIGRAVNWCDLLIVVGTSLTVSI